MLTDNKIERGKHVRRETPQEVSGAILAQCFFLTKKSLYKY